MIDISKLRVGDPVHYQPEQYGTEKWENGLIKRIPDYPYDAVFVVYNCAGNWEKYMDYTAAMTNLRDLKPGWKH